jgi:hypothetical protein
MHGQLHGDIYGDLHRGSAEQAEHRVQLSDGRSKWPAGKYLSRDRLQSSVVNRTGHRNPIGSKCHDGV